MKNKSTKTDIRNNINNYLIWSAVILGIFTVVFEIFLQMIKKNTPIPPIENPHNLWYVTGPLAGLWQILSTFTMQTNILVIIYFFCKLFQRIDNRDKKVTLGPFSLALTTYITITMVIFFVALFKEAINSLKDGNLINIATFANTFLLHLVIPITTISFFLINADNQKWNLKLTVLKYFPFSILYMFVYLGYVLVRGVFVGVIDKNNLNKIKYSFPYNFLNIKNNINLFIIYFFIILFLFMFLYFVLYFYNSWKYKKKYFVKDKIN